MYIVKINMKSGKTITIQCDGVDIERRGNKIVKLNFKNCINSGEIAFINYNEIESVIKESI